MTLTSLKELQVGAPMMVNKNPQKCCTGERISLMPDCNRNNQVSPFSLLPFILSLSRGDSESGIRSKSNSEAAMTPHPLLTHPVSGPIGWEERSLNYMTNLNSGLNGTFLLTEKLGYLLIP